ncbi:MAG: HD-GYP domain-containing protein [Pirellulaceae bacterium]
MRKPVQTVLVLAAIQFLCLAFGLWMQDRILVTAAAWQDHHPPTRKLDVAVLDRTAHAVSAQSLLDAMLPVRLLTLVWTGGLQLVTLYLLVNRMQSDHSQSRQRSEMELKRQEKDLIRTRNAVIFGLANLAESRDRETGRHLERIALYTTKLASVLRSDPTQARRLTSAMVKSIGISSVLHDIGKVGVRDAILLKPGQLSAEERQEMQLHTVIGSQCLQQIERRLGTSNFLDMARQIALYHHERWDGTGYPHRLAGESIPLVARIVALADMYDALSVKRVYKDAFPHERCVEIIRAEAGRHLDPHMVEVFLGMEQEFAEIARRFADAELAEASSATLPLPPQDEEARVLETVLDFEKTIERTLAGARRTTTV